MNIIVLVSDTFRYDYLGVNGNSWIGTDDTRPFRGTRSCLRSPLSVELSDDPEPDGPVHGRYSFPFHGWQPLERNMPVLSTIFGEEGYTSQLIADTPHLMSRGHHFDRDFTGLIGFVARREIGRC